MHHCRTNSVPKTNSLSQNACTIKERCKTHAKSDHVTFSFILIAVAIRISFLENYIVRDRSFFYGLGGCWWDLGEGGGWATLEKEAFEGGGCPPKNQRQEGGVERNSAIKMWKYSWCN